MFPDQIYDKRTIGVPEDIILIRAQVRQLRDEAEALVNRAEYIVKTAEDAEKQRQKNEHDRQVAENERQYYYLKMTAMINAALATLQDYQKALDALGALHDEYDYMVLGSALHTRNGVGTFENDGFKFSQGTNDNEGGLKIGATFYGLEDIYGDSTGD